MPDLTPIQTQYNGHLFRSRLEARWAVFFDALGVRYEYEVEGYDLNGRWYLPDFWLPEVGCFVEIKPSVAEDVEESELFNHTAQLLAIASGKRVLLVYGNPWPNEYCVIPHQHRDFLFYRWHLLPGTRHPDELWLIGDGCFICLNPNTSDHDFPDINSEQMKDAFTAARSARFEHGESGRTL